MNTKQKGKLHFLIFKDKKDPLYTGVCLELNIVEQGEDPKKLADSLVEAAEGHLATVRELDLEDELLNRLAPRAYWKKFHVYFEEREKPLAKDEQAHILIYSWLAVPRRGAPVSISRERAWVTS